MYCLRLFIVFFTRITLFTTMFTVIIVVRSLKSMCIPSFVLIGCCVSEIHVHLCPYIVMYGLRLFIVCLQELHVYYNVYCYYCGALLEKHMYTKFRLD